MSLICSTVAVVLSGCDFEVEKIHPHVLDISRGYARIYQAEKIKNPACGTPDYKFVQTGKVMPIDQMSGYFCLPTKEAQEIIKHFNEETTDQCKTKIFSQDMMEREMVR